MRQLIALVILCFPLVSWSQGSAGAQGVILGMLRSELPPLARHACPAPSDCAYETEIEGIRARIEIWFNSSKSAPEDAERVRFINVFLPAEEQGHALASLKLKYGNSPTQKDDHLEWILPIPKVVPKGLTNGALPDQLLLYSNKKFPDGRPAIMIMYFGLASANWRSQKRRFREYEEKQAEKARPVRNVPKVYRCAKAFAKRTFDAY